MVKDMAGYTLDIITAQRKQIRWPNIYKQFSQTTE